jgi:hypothetical protein
MRLREHARTGSQAARQAVKNEFMEREHGIPVNQTDQAVYVKVSIHS